MDFSITTVFVVPSGNTLPTTGSTQDLAPGQFGIFDNAYAPATAGTVASEPYIYLAQGRSVGEPSNLGSKRSDKIYTKNIKKWYKVTAEQQIPNEILEFSAFNVKCEEDLTLTLRLMSNYINVGFYNGLTRSFWVKAPCCDCGGDPCDTVDAAGIQAIVDEFVAKINADTLVSKFVIAERIGTGATSKVRVNGKVLDKYGNPCEPNSFIYEFDRLTFWGYAHKGPATTQDLEVPDICDSFATVSYLQRAQYGRGSGAEIFEMEKRYYSYQTTHKHIFDESAFNGAFISLTNTAAYYDTYYLEFREEDDDDFMDVSKQSEAVFLAVPTGATAGIEAILVAFAGAVEDKSGTDRTTTTTTSTTSSSTTSTTSTIIFP